jgi:type IV secretion system protein VirB6
MGAQPTARVAQASGNLAAKVGDAAYSAMNTPAKDRAKAAVEYMKAYTANKYK